MELFKINTTEAGKVISLVADTYQTITAMNLVQINTAPSTFDYNAETGEITILRNGLFDCSGSINLINTDDETPDTSISLFINTNLIGVLWRGTAYHKNFSSFRFIALAGDILELKIKSPETIDVQTEDAEHYFNITKFLK